MLNAWVLADTLQFMCWVGLLDGKMELEKYFYSSLDAK